MSCRWTDERIEAWLDGDLAADEARRVAAHLADCAACAAALAAATAVRDGLRGLPSLDAPAALVERVKAGARERADGGAAVRGPWRLPSRPRLVAELTLLAATLALALGLTLRPGTGTPAAGGGVEARRPVAASPAAVLAAARAEREVRVALALVGRYTRRAGDQVRRELARDDVAGRTLRGLGDALAPLGRMDGNDGGGPPSA